MTTELLERVAAWHLEAKDDDDHYFFETRSSDAIQQGEKIFVIGRKGTGKTAICEHIHHSKAHDKFSVLQSFKNFPFNELYKFENEKFKSPNRYISIWKYAILTALCRLMLDNENVDGAARAKLRRIFDFGVEDAFEKKLRKVTDRSFEIQILGTGIATEPVVLDHANEIPLDRRCEIIFDFLDGYLDESSYFILFDELDEDYRDVLVDTVGGNQYFELLVGLFKAAQEIHSYFSKRTKKVYPVVFLRDDIFDLLRDHDKPKWSDKSVDLNWSSTSLKDLLSFRISKARQPSQPAVPFDAAWKQLFSVQRTRVSNARQANTPTFSYLLRSTYLRPRDLISYVRECAKVTLSVGKARVDNEIIKTAERKHSDFMRDELIAEMYSIVPEISEILDMISEIRKPIITRKEFDDNYRNLQKRVGGKTASLPTQRILELLYYFGAIGNVTTGNHQVYKHDSPRSKYNRRENISVHRSLLKTLDIY